MFLQLKLDLFSLFPLFGKIMSWLRWLGWPPARQLAMQLPATSSQAACQPAPHPARQLASQPARQLSHIHLAAPEKHEKALFLQLKLIFFPLFPLFPDTKNQHKRPQITKKAVFLQLKLFFFPLFPLFPLFGKIFLWSHANTLPRVKKPSVK